MMGFGFMEVVMLALLSSGQSNTDLVAFISPAHYFASKQIDVSIDKMMELAASDPKDARTQVMQLTALRYLTEESVVLKQAPKYAAHRQTLEQIAQGKTALDSLGFSKDYALRLLAKLDGEKIKPAKVPLLREDAFAWFPADASLVLAFDLRQVGNFNASSDPLKELLKMIPEAEKKEMYGFIEKSGNVRMERFSFAMTDSKEREKKKYMLRFTGKANQIWLVETFKSMPHANFQVKYMKDPRGTPVTLLQEPDRAPIMALVGNTDMLIVGYDKDEAKHAEILDALIMVREKKQPGATTGALKTQLAKIPDNAIALIVGELPEAMKRDFRALDAVPTKIAAYVVRDKQGLDVNVESTMVNEEDASKLVNKVGMLRKEGIKALQQAQEKPLPPGTPPIPFGALVNLMESLQVQNKKDTVQVRLVVPENLLRQMGSMSMMMFGRAGMAAPPAQVKPVEVKEPKK